MPKNTSEGPVKKEEEGKALKQYRLDNYILPAVEQKTKIY